MNLLRFSFGENRLLHISRRTIQSEAQKRQQAQAVATRASQPYASTGGVNPDAAKIQELVKVNFDESKATPQEIIDHNRGMALASSTTGAPRVTAAPTPSSLTTGARGIAGATGDTTKSTDALGNIDQGALQRLMDSGMTEGQARSQITSLRPSIQQTTSTTGLPGGTSRKAPTGIGDTLRDDISKSDAAIDATYNRLRAEGGIVNNAMVEEEKRRAREQITNQANIDQKDAQMKQEQKDVDTRRNASMDTPTATKGGTKSETTTKPNPVSENNKSQFQALQAVLNSNPVFAGSDYGQIIAAMMAKTSSVDADEIFLQQMADFLKEDKDFSGATDAVEAGAAESKRLLTERTEKQDAINQRHLEIAKETAEISKSMQEFEKQKFEINQKIREQEQAEANIEGEQKNRRIANKMGIETDTSGLKFMRDEVRKGKEALQRLSEFGDAQRGQYALQIGRQYSLDINNALLRYDEQQLIIDSNFANNLKDIDNTVSMDAKERRERKDGMWKDYWNMKMTQDKETAETVRAVGGKMMDAMSQQRDDERATEQMGWNILDDAVARYGSLIPKSTIDRVTAMLPAGTDIKDYINTPTIAERNSKKIAGGGNATGTGFKGYGTGTEFSTDFGHIPTFDEFVKQKNSENRTMVGPQTNESYKAEYDAMVIQESKYTTGTIWKMFADKVETNADLAKHSKDSARTAVQNAINQGDFKEARRLVDGVGKAPGQKQRENFEQAVIVRQGIAEINALIDDLGATGPVIGRFRTLNPYDDRIVRLQQLTTQVIPGLARGIYKEVGVLTDTDIATYRSTMANPNLTYDQAKTATKDTMRKIQLSMDTTLESWDASKLNTRDYRTMAEKEPDVSAIQSSPTTPSSQGGSVSDYVNSLK